MMSETDPEKAQRLYYFSLVLRGALAIMTCFMGFIAGDFSTFLNLQGALVGTLISYVLPCLFFLKMTTYVRAMRAQMEQEAAEKQDHEYQEGELEERDKLLKEMIEDMERVETEPAHISTDKLADETKIEKFQRFICYVMIIFGSVGGLLSFLVSSTTIFQEITTGI